MDPIQDNAAAQEPAAPLEAAAAPDKATSSPSGTDDTDEVEIVCIRAIQSRELGVIAEPGERRIIPRYIMETFVSTDAFQVLGTVVRQPPPRPATAKPTRRSKTE
jgi:hypothetical protein